jgi:hypothetical protein
MSSFIDLMASDVWSEYDILNRTEAMIASAFPRARYAILDRKFKGALAGHPEVMDAPAQAELQEYESISFQAGAMADAARADMALLNRVLAVEAAQRRLLEAAIDGDEADAASRAAAQSVVDAADPQTLALVAQRIPAPAEISQETNQ